MKNEYLIDAKFTEFILHDFWLFSKEKSLKSKPLHLIKYLVNHKLIEPITIKRYTVLKEFARQYPLHFNHKTKTVETLTDIFSIPERTVWTMT